jgi:transaldolase
MRLFLHSADLTEVRQELRRGVVSGLTTEVALMADLGAAAQLERLARLCAEVPGPVRAQVTASDTEEMVAQASVLSRVAPHLVASLPPSAAGLAALKRCVAGGIPISVVGCRSPLEALQAALLGARSVSPQVTDQLVAGQPPLCEMIRQMLGAFQTYGLTTEIWVGPLADSGQVLDVAVSGAQAVSAPLPTLQVLLSHPRRDGRARRAA